MKQRVWLAFFLLFLGVVVSYFFTANQSDKTTNKLYVVSSFTIIADIARNVAGDAAVVESITKPGAEIHDYQPTPKDILKAKKADLILWNGLNLERWYERFTHDVSHVPRVVVSEGITPLSIHSGEYAGKPNPHAWMSIDNALIYIENIRKAFVDYDPDNALVYNTNAQQYSEELIALGETFTAYIDTLPKQKRFLVTSEGAFSYLAQDLRLTEVFIWPMNADQQGTPKQIKRVVDIVNKYNIPVVFSESTVSPKPAKQIANETKAEYGGVLYVDSLSDGKGPVSTYKDMLKVTIETISLGFKKRLEK